jgi:hypothetical protein
VRFGCGATVGAVLGLFWALGSNSPITWVGLAARILVAAVLFGVLAATLGDRFWRRSLWWWAALAVAGAAFTLLWPR